MKVTSYIYNLLPSSLTSRFVLIIAVPMIMVQVAGIYIFYDRHWSNIFTSTSTMVAREVKLVINIASKTNLKEAIKEAKFIGLSIEHLSAKEAGYIPTKTHPYLVEFVKILERQISKKASAILINDDTEIQILIKMNDGYWKVRRSVKPLINPTTHIFALWMLGLTCLLLTIALIFLRNQIRSILELASAIFNLNTNDVAHYKPSGAIEIRRAGLAFLRTKERIERYIAKRTQMLAMISHDLKTPLTRLKLQLEMMNESDEKTDMQRDIVSMQQMISSYLDFARGEGEEVRQKVHILDWFKENILLHTYSNLEISLAEEVSNPEILIKKVAFKRAVENIITNAAKYASKLIITIDEDDSQVIISFDDNGIGISDEEKPKVFKPFYRSDASRNIDSQGSVGLGLSITREIILGHNGDIKLYDSFLGGLQIKIILPTVIK